MEGSVNLEIADQVALLSFSHPKANCLTRELLQQLCEKFNKIAKMPSVSSVLLISEGESSFCAGAALHEFRNIATVQEGTDFLMDIGKLILSMIRCPKFVITRVQGKAAGGGLGLIAGADYAIAHKSASVCLPEISIGIGPFVIGPVVERKIGPGPFYQMTIDGLWRDSKWAANAGLYANVCETLTDLDTAVESLVGRLKNVRGETASSVKKILWQGTEDWENLLTQRAKRCSELLISSRKHSK